MSQKQIAIIGGGATGAAMLWALTRDQAQRDGFQATLFHNEKDLGGHSDTYFVKFDAAGKGTIVPDMTPGSYAVDIGVQFVCPPVYPNMYTQLKLPEFAGIEAMRLKSHPALKIAAGFQDDLNWGNFPEYRSGPRFEKILQPQAIEQSDTFCKDLSVFDLDWWFTWNIDRYLTENGVPRDGNFFRYMLMAYLTIINGYGTDEMLTMTKRDLFPIFSKIPLLQHVGPLGSFSDVGKGWDRFEFGAQRWVEGMAEFGVQRGAVVNKECTVTKIVPKVNGTNKVRLEWLDAGNVAHAAEFDVVVSTVDMDINKGLLNHGDNPLWNVQKDYLGDGVWSLMPGLCVIHQDEEVLAPSLRDQKEDAHFNAYYTWTGTTAGNLFDLPYKLENTFTTYVMKNILDTPAPCYVSMYAVADHAKRPDPSKVIFEKTWKHGRWVSTHDMAAKQRLHEIQGLGNVWFAGNNATVDSEEGALISAVAVAEKMAGFDNPLSHDLLAYETYHYFQKLMFPPKTLAQLLGLAPSNNP